MAGHMEDELQPSKMLSHGNLKQEKTLTGDYAFCRQILHHARLQPYLGVNLDNKLSWGEQVDNTVTKENHTLGFLKMNLWFCP